MKTEKLIDIGLFLILIILAAVTASVGYCNIFIYGALLTGARSIDSILLIIMSLISLLLVLCIVKCGSKAKKRVLFAAYIVIAVEVMLQTASIFGLLPGVSIYDHVPYGRVYWTREGFCNSVMNRYGWHYPPFDLKTESKRVVLIGDSFLQAVQVSPHRNVGVLLQERLRAKGGTGHDTEVISTGLSGIGPAQYLELLKYASEYLGADEVVIFITVGNDFISSPYKIKEAVPDERIYYQVDDYIYYQVDAGGDLTLRPGGAAARDQFVRRLEANHLSLAYTFGRTAFSHSMILQVVKSMALNFRTRYLEGEEMPGQHTESGIRDELLNLGLADFIFRKNPSPEATEAFTRVTSILEKSRQYADSKGIQMRLITIPLFPKVFYSKYESSDWSLDIGDYDFLLPEKVLIDFAEAHDIPILPMGKYMHEDKLTPDQIKELYLFEGRGHFSLKGHEYFTGPIFSRFYND